MGVFAKGEVVLVPYPFSDLSETKLRPSLVLAAVSNNDYVLCQITSRPYTTRMVVPVGPLENPDSGLHLQSFARPEKLFTANESIIVERIGTLSRTTTLAVAQAIGHLLEI